MSQVEPSVSNIHNASSNGDMPVETAPTNSIDQITDITIAETGKRPKQTFADVSSLQLPPSLPIRPLSPDVLSILSFEEYEQLAPRPPHSTAPKPAASTSSGRPQGWLQRFWIRNKGLMYIVVAQLFGTLMNITTRLLEVEGNKGKGLHPFQILFVRMIITCALCLWYMWHRQTPHYPFGAKELRWLLMARGFFGFFGVFGMYYSLLYLPLSDAIVITFLAPALACWACSILIKEPFTRAEQIGAAVSLAGVVLIARPSVLFKAVSGDGSPSAVGGVDTLIPGNSTTTPVDASKTHTGASDYDNVTPTQHMAAVGVALLGVLGSAGAFTTIRWVGQRAHPLIVVNYFATACTIVSIIMMSAMPGVGFILPADVKEWGYLLFLGTCGFVMQFLLAAGLAYEKSSRATNMAYTQMLFALAGDKFFFGHTPGIMSIVGSSLILGSAIVVAIQRDPNRGQEESPRNSASDEESQRGLLSGMDNVAAGDDREPLPIENVQLRTLR